MFEELVKALLYSWQDADAEQVEAWARGEAWAELQALAQCKAAQQSVQPTAMPFGWLSRIDNFIINLIDWRA